MTVPITGYPSSYRAPFTAAEILLGQGSSTASSGARDVCFVGPMTSAGTWTVNTVNQVKTEQDVITGAGAGSFLHRMVRRFLMGNKTAKVYAVPYAETSGMPTSATGTVTFTTTGSATGAARVYVCGEEISIQIVSGQTITATGDLLEAGINAKTHLPVTASNSGGTVTLTAKHAGVSSGDGTVGVIPVRAEIDAGIGTTIATTGAIGLGAGADGAEGSTTEVTNLTAALAAIASRRFYYMGFSVWNAAQTAVIETHVSNISEPNPGLRCTSWVGYRGALSDAQTIAIARNFERHHIVWQDDGDHDPADLVGAMLAVVQKREEFDAAFPGFDNYRASDFTLSAAPLDSDWPDADDIDDAVTDGLIPIASDQYGARIGMMVNTRSKDSSGTTDDFRACERHRVSALDKMVDDILLQHQQTFVSVGFKLRDDRRLPDGTVDFNQRIPPRTLTPSRYASWFKARLTTAESQGLIQDAEAWKESTGVDIDPNNVSRIRVSTSGRTVDILHQTSISVAETTPN